MTQRWPQATQRTRPRSRRSQSSPSRVRAARRRPKGVGFKAIAGAPRSIIGPGRGHPPPPGSSNDVKPLPSLLRPFLPRSEREGELNGEGRSARGTVRGLDGSAVGLDDLLHDREAKAGSIDPTAEEGLEKPWHVRGGDPAAFVFDLENDRPVRGQQSRSQLDRAPSWGMLNGIRDEILENLIHAHGVDLDRGK